MSNLQELICITCPKGCVTKVWKEKGDIKIEGKICKKGKEYIQQEYIEPKRVLTTTVVVEQCPIKRLPVRTQERRVVRIDCDAHDATYEHPTVFSLLCL